MYKQENTIFLPHSLTTWEEPSRDSMYLLWHKVEITLRFSESDPHTKGESPRPYSVFDLDAGRERGLAWILEVALCWHEGMSPGECAALTGSGYDDVALWFGHCGRFFGEACRQTKGRNRKR